MTSWPFRVALPPRGTSPFINRQTRLGSAGLRSPSPFCTSVLKTQWLPRRSHLLRLSTTTSRAVSLQTLEGGGTLHEGANRQPLIYKWRPGLSSVFRIQSHGAATQRISRWPSTQVCVTTASSSFLTILIDLYYTDVSATSREHAPPASGSFCTRSGPTRILTCTS